MRTQAEITGGADGGRKDALWNIVKKTYLQEHIRHLRHQNLQTQNLHRYPDHCKGNNDIFLSSQKAETPTDKYDQNISETMIWTILLS